MVDGSECCVSFVSLHVNTFEHKHTRVHKHCESIEHRNRNTHTSNKNGIKAKTANYLEICCDQLHDIRQTTEMSFRFVLLLILSFSLIGSLVRFWIDWLLLLLLLLSLLLGAHKANTIVSRANTPLKLVIVLFENVIGVFTCAQHNSVFGPPITRLIDSNSVCFVQ